MSTSADVSYCSKCKVYRGSTEFSAFKSGKPKKTCNHHEKRSLEETLDSWEAFLLNYGNGTSR